MDRCGRFAADDSQVRQAPGIAFVCCEASKSDLGERLIGCRFALPAELFHISCRELEVLMLQTLDVGPIAQAVTGIDTAV